MTDVPLLDDRAACPGCGDDVWTWLLCGCDDETGPLCVDRCCPSTHNEPEAAA